MATIGWLKKPADAWVVAGWAFRQVLEDVRSQYPTDADLISELELARDLKYLFIDSFNPDLAKRLASGIRDTAAGIHSGTIRSGILNKSGFTENDVKEYRVPCWNCLRLFPTKEQSPLLGLDCCKIPITLKVFPWRRARTSSREGSALSRASVS